MAGERTPDTSPLNRQGSTDDEISLREHMQRQIDAQWKYAERLHADQGAYFERVIAEYRVQLDERYQTQMKALDAAFASAEKAVQAALTAAETAVAKAESASDKRFEAVNEFRGQLNDIVTTLISRAEAEARMTANTDKMLAIDERLSVRLRELESRIDLTQGRSTGIDKAWGYVVGVVGLVGGVIAIVIAVTQ